MLWLPTKALLGCCSWFNKNIVGSMRLYYESMGPNATASQSAVRLSQKIRVGAQPCHEQPAVLPGQALAWAEGCLEGVMEG